LEKTSPRGDTGNEPVFCLRFPKEANPVSSARETTGFWALNTRGATGHQRQEFCSET
jgi:hypothetical protein